MNRLKWVPAVFFCILSRLAIGETIDGGVVTIEFDRTTFAFDRDDTVSVVPIAPESVDIHAIEHGVELDFNDQFLLSDAATGENDSLIGVLGNFNAGFSFTPDPGYTIYGYRVTIFGTYSIEFPGQASVSTNGQTYSFLSGPQGSFRESFETTGAVAPPLLGVVSALGDVSFTEVAVGAQSVYVRSDYLPDPACPDPDPATCPLIEVPIYEEVTLYERQADLGAAGVNLQGIRLEAIVVPEPASGLFLGVGWLAVVRGRRSPFRPA